MCISKHKIYMTFFSTERVIADIKGSVIFIWEIEIALNTASQPPWFLLAQDRNLSYGEISDIGNHIII